MGPLTLLPSPDISKFQEHTSSVQAFRAAVLRFPSLLPLVLDKVDIPLSAEVRSKPAFKVHVDSS